jgi:alkylation response protein AidB-like acyl-CoA dehydrogenase
MDFELTEEQVALKHSVQGFLDREAPSSTVAAWSRHGTPLPASAYSNAAKAGWIGMMAPAALGGGDAEARDCAVVFEQLGRAPIPGPFFTSGVLAPLLVFEAGSDEQRRHLIPAICDGSEIYAVALFDADDGGPSDALALTGNRKGGEVVLQGRKRFVIWAEAATRLVCLAQGSAGPFLITVPIEAPGVQVKPHRGFLGSLCDIEFLGVRVHPDDILAGDEVMMAVGRAISRSIPILSAFKVGACDRLFDMTIEYANERVVFGQPIGRFQRVQDHCVDLVNHLDKARWITYEALWRVDTGLPSSAEVHEAKAVSSEAYYEVCNAAHMVFAGPGTALDHPLVAHTLMSRLLYHYLGGPRYHKDEMMRAILSRR